MQRKGFMGKSTKDLNCLLSRELEQVRRVPVHLPLAMGNIGKDAFVPRAIKRNGPAPQLKSELLGISKSTTTLITQQHLHFRRVNIKFNGSLMSKSERIFYSESFPSQQLQQFLSEKLLIPTVHHLTQRADCVTVSQMLM